MVFIRIRKVKNINKGVDSMYSWVRKYLYNDEGININMANNIVTTNIIPTATLPEFKLCFLGEALRFQKISPMRHGEKNPEARGLIIDFIKSSSKITKDMREQMISSLSYLDCISTHLARYQRQFNTELKNINQDARNAGLDAERVYTSDIYYKIMNTKKLNSKISSILKKIKLILSEDPLEIKKIKGRVSYELKYELKADMRYCIREEAKKQLSVNPQHTYLLDRQKELNKKRRCSGWNYNEKEEGKELPFKLKRMLQARENLIKKSFNYDDTWYQREVLKIQNLSKDSEEVQLYLTKLRHQVKGLRKCINHQEDLRTAVRKRISSDDLSIFLNLLSEIKVPSKFFEKVIGDEESFPGVLGSSRTVFLLISSKLSSYLKNYISIHRSDLEDSFIKNLNKYIWFFEWLFADIDLNDNRSHDDKLSEYIGELWRKGEELLN